MQRKKFPPLLTQVWTKAKEALLTANAVLFIGYRFPETDCEAISLLARTCKDKPVEIVVKGLEVSYKERFRNLFTNLRLFDRSFATWVET